MAHGHNTEHRLRVRAQLVLHAARGRSNARIARETGLHLDTVRRWRGRIAQAGLPGLKERQRCGRPASFTPLQATEVKAPACRLPAETGVPISRWSCPELAREAITRQIVTPVSPSTVRRWLTEDAWQGETRKASGQVLSCPDCLSRLLSSVTGRPRCSLDADAAAAWTMTPYGRHSHSSGGIRHVARQGHPLRHRHLSQRRHVAPCLRRSGRRTGHACRRGGSALHRCPYHRG
ncbi:helix-turn-helix domain-containing protein [Streptomyces hygroscopicus]|uniref:helix-turn-helix domain-containing protein n=1 Tax=Streptomyces hygroscopicus TaxID=1912 RepID=UPI001FCCBDF3|nr:helix-turn-helix domain-containing protein [Streptomyces hygroscopicus]